MLGLYLWPTIYSTFGPRCEDFRFVRLSGMGWRGQRKWQPIKRVRGPLWKNDGTPFWDWPNMFRRHNEP
jgi:hypothetical protein